MKKGRLTWFDRVMVSITFAEADVEEHGRQYWAGFENRQSICRKEQRELFANGQDSTIPAHS